MKFDFQVKRKEKTVEEKIEELKKYMRMDRGSISPSYPSIEIARDRISYVDLILGFIALKEVYGEKAARGELSK